MRHRIISTRIEIIPNLDDLEEPFLSLMKTAIEVRSLAYAPYSNFKVGAALLLENGLVVSGNNQENAAFPSGLCAERIAAFYAGAHHSHLRFSAMAISACSSEKVLCVPIGPCGSCRQSLLEYEQLQDSPITLYLMGETGEIFKVGSIKDLLPLYFEASVL